MLEKLLPGASHLQNIHPLIVHFPIAFLCGATLFYFIGAGIKNDGLKWAAMWVLILGTIGAAVALLTGYEASQGVMIAPTVRSALLEYHEWLMFATGAIALVLTIWAIVAHPMPARLRWLFMVGLVVMCAVMVKGTDYGGRMVYDYNAGGNACPQPIPFTK